MDKRFKFESAQVRVRVPPRRWKSKAEVVAWAREQLAGAPPLIKASVPEGHPDAGKAANWKHVQEGLFAGQTVTLVSDHPGLIRIDLETGRRTFVPSASSRGLVLGHTKAGKFINSIEEERALRAFVREENDRFNKQRQREAERDSRSWTFAWHQHGKRIREFVLQHNGISTERVWQELVKWGQGQGGYGRQTHQDATYFYDWIGEANADHPVFSLSTTRIQHILWADRTRTGRDRLLEAITSGPFRGLSDDEFAWVVGKRTKNWPLEPTLQEELKSIGTRVRAGTPLDDQDLQRFFRLLQLVRDRPKR